MSLSYSGYMGFLLIYKGVGNIIGDHLVFRCKF